MIGGIQSGMQMSPEMMTSMREQMFAKLDSDGDGQIDLAQLQTEAEEMGVDDARFSDLVEHLTAADTDGNGMVSQAEFEAMEPPEPPAMAMQGSTEDVTGTLLDYLYSDEGTTDETNHSIGELLNTLA